MKFSVIIPTYNDWKRLMHCLNALEEQAIEKDQYEIIVIDNSESGTVPADLGLPGKVRLVYEPKPGSYAARNRGAEVAVGEILAFTDSDCIPDKNWLANAKNHFSRLTCDLVGGRVDIFQTGNGDKYGYLYERLTAFHQHKNVPAGREVTANLFIHAKLFSQIFTTYCFLVIYFKLSQLKNLTANAQVLNHLDLKFETGRFLKKFTREIFCNYQKVWVLI